MQPPTFSVDYGKGPGKWAALSGVRQVRKRCDRQGLRQIHPTGFEPVTFGSVDRCEGDITTCPLSDDTTRQNATGGAKTRRFALVSTPSTPDQPIPSSRQKATRAESKRPLTTPKIPPPYIGSRGIGVAARCSPDFGCMARLARASACIHLDAGQGRLGKLRPSCTWASNSRRTRINGLW